MLTAGDRITQQDFVRQLSSGGYSPARSDPVGWYRTLPGAVEVFPGTKFGNLQPARIEFQNGTVSRIVSLPDKARRTQFDFGPQLIANLSSQRQERLMVRYGELPPCLVHAVISAEDKRFFEHSGVDIFRVLKAAYVDLKEGRKEQGASTLTMQLARSFWLNPDKRWKRKMKELLIALHLDRKLSKEQIFEDYANQVYLGTHATYNISGFGEASREYFGKNVWQLDLPEAALLAGMIQRPSYFDPCRHPDRARERRNVVLLLMRENGYLTEAQYRGAISAPLGLEPHRTEDQEAQFFISLMHQELRSRVNDTSVRSVYTTLDPQLQSMAEAAVRQGMESVDKMLAARRHGKAPAEKPEVALIALDPHTGAIRAMVGGRNFSRSQLDHILSRRQPGSVFKPFVYAAALDDVLARKGPIFTPASILDDEPATFYFGNQVYRPGNFNNEFMGEVTLQTALAHSLNSASVQLAQQVGFQRVLDLARAAGLSGPMQPTPALALGAYEASPLEIAEAYTVFANQGIRVSPTTLSRVLGEGGNPLFQEATEWSPVLDPRVAFQIDSMLQEVLRSGTGASARAHGFDLPAAGKTGTTRDGWFAGFTTKLLCVVWVGFDDNRDLRIEGSRSALPIWANFMEHAASLRRYGDPQPFPKPKGVVWEEICSASGQVAGPDCGAKELVPFIAGTEPTALPAPQPAGNSVEFAGTDQRAPQQERGQPAAIPPSQAKPAATPATLAEPPESPSPKAQPPSADRVTLHFVN